MISKAHFVSVFVLRDVKQGGGRSAEGLLAEDTHQQLSVLDQNAGVAGRDPVVRSVVFLKFAD